MILRMVHKSSDKLSQWLKENAYGKTETFLVRYTAGLKYILEDNKITIPFRQQRENLKRNILQTITWAIDIYWDKKRAYKSYLLDITKTERSYINELFERKDIEALYTIWENLKEAKSILDNETIDRTKKEKYNLFATIVYGETAKTILEEKEKAVFQKKHEAFKKGFNSEEDYLEWLRRQPTEYLERLNLIEK